MKKILALVMLIFCGLYGITQSAVYNSVEARQNMQIPRFADSLPPTGKAGAIIILTNTADSGFYYRNSNNTGWLKMSLSDVGSVFDSLTTNGIVNTINTPNYGLRYSDPDSVTYGENTLMPYKYTVDSVYTIGDSVLNFRNGAGIIQVAYISFPKAGTPTGSADAAGRTGDIWYDDSYWYYKSASGWRRIASATW